MLLLFEIGRRLVTGDYSSDRKKRFDELPIASAITSLVKLMETNQCTFEEVFTVGKKFHCFTGEPEVRKNAILRINYHHALNEIEQMFSPEQPETETGLEIDVKELNV